MSHAGSPPSRTEPPPVKCLLVDDLDENLLAMAAVLQAPGVELLTARSGPEALELLLAHEIALAFLDVQMPEMDGFELAELIRGSERTRNVPLIFVTAGSGDRHRSFKGYERGAVDFLHKPVDPVVLRSKAEVFFRLHRQQQQLARDLQERTETLRLNEMFAAVLGHDLRNPLGTILTGVGALQRSQDPVVRKLAGHMRTSGVRMARMIDDLLDLTRVRLGGGFTIDRRPLDLQAVVRPVVDEHLAANADRAIHLVCEGGLQGRWDADRLAQAASNLIGNALQHGAPGSPVTVHLDGRPAEAVRLTVENDGAIAPEVVAGLFVPFAAAARANEARQGLGLGLYIVEQIARAHGGDVQVRSSDGRSRFTVTLPRDAAEPTASRSAAVDAGRRVEVQPRLRAQRETQPEAGACD